MRKKVILTIAPTGNVPAKKDNPSVPLSPREIVDDIMVCYELGASVAHIHARDLQGLPTTNQKVFRQIKDKLAARCNIITQFSTGARGGQDRERGDCLDEGPEMASLTTGSSNFAKGINSNSPELIEYLARKMYENGIVPEIEVFDVAMIANARYLLQKGVLKEPLNFNLVLNVPGSIPGSPKNLLHLAESLPAGCNFSVTAVGRAHADLIAVGIAMGANIRVGLEDTLVYSYSDGIPATNAMLVERAVRLIQELGREVAAPEEAREVLGIN
ncbi:MAG: hypothetical protein VR67_13135 [Peptococcaceae bacterium BRH_c8a]|nr:MAG: hypothetical protein VR67_13135 [Peptococcaceae bacterium BRH_c8a]